VSTYLDSLKGLAAGRYLKVILALGGPTFWSFEGGFGSSGMPGWGPTEGWIQTIIGAINPFRISGETIYQGAESVWNPDVPVVISEIPETWDELEELHPELFEPILETRPGRTPDAYPGTDAAVVLGDPTAGGTTPAQDDLAVTEDWNVAHDWGHWIRESLTGIAGEVFGSNGAQPANIVQGNGVIGPGSTTNQIATQAAMATDCDGMTWAGGAPPKGYKVVRDSCGNGVLRKVRRRRRRRMLTSGDKDDIASIVSMVGKGQMASALINGSMRRG
jgi:hypothetical protein